MTIRQDAADAARSLTQCAGKDRFESPALAGRIAARVRAGKDCRSQPYHCSTCRGWHVGTLNPVQRKAATQNRYRAHRARLKEEPQ